MAKDKSIGTILPNVECLIILKPAPKGGKCYDIVNLDEYFSADDIVLKKQIYLDQIEKWGQDNVRYCKVVNVTVQQEVNFE